MVIDSDDLLPDYSFLEGCVYVSYVLAELVGSYSPNQNKDADNCRNEKVVEGRRLVVELELADQRVLFYQRRDLVVLVDEVFFLLVGTVLEVVFYFVL